MLFDIYSLKDDALVREVVCPMEYIALQIDSKSEYAIPREPAAPKHKEEIDDHPKN